ncbi:hypothetical protein BH11PLA1_BH11PLA1_03540 [soil metagenome]
MILDLDHQLDALGRRAMSEPFDRELPAEAALLLLEKRRRLGRRRALRNVLALAACAALSVSAGALWFAPRPAAPRAPGASTPATAAAPAAAHPNTPDAENRRIMVALPGDGTPATTPDGAAAPEAAAKTVPPVAGTNRPDIPTPYTKPPE